MMRALMPMIVERGGGQASMYAQTRVCKGGGGGKGGGEGCVNDRP